MSDNFISITLTSEDVAEVLKCSVPTVLDKAGSGEIRGAKIGKLWLFKQEDVQAFLDEQIEQQTQARKSRYTPQDINQIPARGFSGPIKKRQGPPDLSAYRQFLKS